MFKRTLFIRTKTQSANFRGNLLYQATTGHLNNTEVIAFLYLLFSCPVLERKFKRTLFIKTKTQSAIFRGNPLYQATKRHLNNKKYEK